MFVWARNRHGDPLVAEPDRTLRVYKTKSSHSHYGQDRVGGSGKKGGLWGGNFCEGVRASRGNRNEWKVERRARRADNGARRLYNQS